jgi:hypothetical protein
MNPRGAPKIDTLNRLKDTQENRLEELPKLCLNLWRYLLAAAGKHMFPAYRTDLSGSGQLQYVVASPLYTPFYSAIFLSDGL